VTGNSATLSTPPGDLPQVYLNLHRFDAARPFFSWIYRIMNESLDTLAQRAFVALDRNGGGEAIPGAPAPGARPVGSPRRVLELPPEQRTVIVLRHFHGLSYQEMSEVVGVPVKTVKSRLFEARSALRDRLVRLGLAP
jgi:RNA polymerase sigma-70 factor (ECF subfamily)